MRVSPRRPRQVGEYAGPVINLDDDNLALAIHGELRERQRVPGGLGMRHEDVKLDVGARPHARRGREVDAGIADRSRDARQRAGFVLELYD